MKPHAGKIDGVYFSMHGAMGTTELLDPEGYLLEEARKILGNDVPIVIPNGLTGILTAKMFRTLMVWHLFTLIHSRFWRHWSTGCKISNTNTKRGSQTCSRTSESSSYSPWNELIPATGAFGAQIPQRKNSKKTRRTFSRILYLQPIHGRTRTRQPSLRFHR
ncbi:MAG: hypothetical protein Ct9H300mP19_11980 [Dehalococcoidia bacterium]|nr:MAG: hypothetical protein Ct9H300mP19_11980 [Dehalococcoidia bacterium]